MNWKKYVSQIWAKIDLKSFYWDHLLANFSHYDRQAWYLIGDGRYTGIPGNPRNDLKVSWKLLKNLPTHPKFPSFIA